MAGSSEFGGLIRAARERRRMSQESLAQDVGIDRTYLNRIENGRIKSPREDIRLRLLGALELPTTSLIPSPSTAIDAVARPARIFCAYSHKDEPLLEELKEHLSPLRRQKRIGVWYDGMIKPGEELTPSIDSQLESADIIVLLVSASFMASDFAHDREMLTAMRRHTNGDVVVLPIIVRAVDWHSSPFSILKALPKDGTPVTSQANRDVAWLEVVSGIRTVVEEWSSKIQKRAMNETVNPSEETEDFETTEVTIDDEPTLLESVLETQSAIVDIWSSLGRLDEVGNTFSKQMIDGPDLVKAGNSSDPNAALQSIKAVFSRVAANLVWLSDSIEAEIVVMRPAWKRLESAEPLFSSFLPISTPEARSGAEGLLSAVPGLQEQFPGLIASLQKVRVDMLPELKGKSRELNVAVNRSDRAIEEMVDTLSLGREIASRLTQALRVRLESESPIQFALVVDRGPVAFPTLPCT